MCQGQTLEGSVDVPTLSTPKRRFYTSANSHNEQNGLARFCYFARVLPRRRLCFCGLYAVSQACVAQRTSHSVPLDRVLTPART